MDFDAHTLIEPDAVLASQFFDALRRQGLPEGEYRLMLAVLEDALHCFVQHAGDTDRDKRELYADAARWITGPSDGGLYSFATICDVLGIDAGFLRGRLLKQRDATLARRRNAAVAAGARR